MSAGPSGPVSGDLFEGTAALDPFYGHLPDSPFCGEADGYRGLRILPRDATLRRPQIQHQPPWLRVHLTFDIDRDGAWCAHEAAGLPAPTWTAVNRQNGHGHLVYSLTAPVLMGPAGPGGADPQVERALRVLLGADGAYAGFTTKNPSHRRWVVIATGKTYELAEIHEYVGDLRKYARLAPEAAGVGRNVETVRRCPAACLPGSAGVLGTGPAGSVGAIPPRRGARLHARAARPGAARSGVPMDRALNRAVDVAPLLSGEVPPDPGGARSQGRQGEQARGRSEQHHVPATLGAVRRESADVVSTRQAGRVSRGTE